jgi:L-gulonolactone oxidase
MSRRIDTLKKHIQPDESSQKTFTNWAKIHSCTPKYYHQPSTEHEIIHVMQTALKSNEKIKVVGIGHSPSDIACTNDHMISLHEHYNRILMIDREYNRVRVQSGIQLKTLNYELETKYNMSLSSLGSISEQTIAGAISTGTHGTGIEFGSLATSIVQLQVLCYYRDPSSDEIQVRKITLNKDDKRDQDLFRAHLCGLGALGIISTLTIQCEPLFYLRAIQKPMKLEQLLPRLSELIPSEDHWRFWWFPHTGDCISWGASRVPPKELIHKPKNVITTMTNAIARRLNPITNTQHIQVYVKDRLIGFHLLELLLFMSKFLPRLVPIINRFYYWYLFSYTQVRTDVSYKIFNFDCLFYQFVNEWSIPIEHTATAMKQIKKMIEKNKYRVHFPIEVRFVKGDDIWMSPCYGRDSCYIGIIMYRPYNYTIEYRQYFEDFFKIMYALGGRPHWAKEFSVSDDQLIHMYPMWHRFKQIREEMDPKHIFENDYLKRLFTSI